MSYLDDSALSEMDRKGSVNEIFKELFRYTFSRRGGIGTRKLHLFESRNSNNAEEVDAEIKERTDTYLRTENFYADEEFTQTTGELRKGLWIAKTKLIDITGLNNNFGSSRRELESLGVTILDKQKSGAYYRLVSDEIFEIILERYEEEIKPLDSYEKHIFERLLADDVEPPNIVSEDSDEFVLFEEIKEDLRTIFRDYLEWQAKAEVHDTVKEKLLRRINRISDITAETHDTSEVRNLHKEKVEFLKATFAAEEFSKEFDSEARRNVYLKHLKSRLSFSKFLNLSGESKDEEIMTAIRETSNDIQTDRTFFSKAKFLISRIFHL